MLTFRADFGPAIDRFDRIADQARDQNALLKRFAGYLNWSAKQKFEAQPGWAPLAPSTLAKLAQTRTSAITTQGKLRSSYVNNAAVQLSRKLRTGGIAARENLSELLRLGRGGSALESILTGGAGSGSRSVERLRRGLLKAAAQRAAGKQVKVGGDRRKLEKHQLLGKLRKSLERSIEPGKAVVESRVPWSRVHNEGGTAGHGAEEPPRVFLTVDQNGAIALAEITLSHLTGDTWR